jgi:hypothetical protein
MIRIIVLVALFATSTAQAAPPPAGSEDALIMAPYKKWIERQNNTDGRWCCDWSDGRPVDAEICGDQWWAHVTPSHWPGAPDQWIEVPADKVLHTQNPVGQAILWLRVAPPGPEVPLYVYCFSPPNGV